MPAGLHDRAEDVWEALIAIADLAAGDWPARGRRAAQVLTAAADSAAADSTLALTLLADLRTVFGNTERLPTSVILDRLQQLEESPWSGVGKPPKPLDAHGLSRMLKEYSVRPKVLRIGEGTARGYYRAELADAWERYAPRKGNRNDRNDRNAAGEVAIGCDGVTGEGVTPSQGQGAEQDRYGVTPVTDTPLNECSDDAAVALVLDTLGGSVIGTEWPPGTIGAYANPTA